MTSTDPKTNSHLPKAPRPKRRSYTHYSYSAQEKAQAVLSVWTERASPAEICRQLNINWITFHQWQRRAMEGMLQALQSHVNLAKGTALSPRLQALLQKHLCQAPAKTSQRLEGIQNKLANPPESAAQKS
jgi:transposase-like protein